MSERDKKDSPDQVSFRVHCQEWLAKNHPGDPPVKLPLGALELSEPESMKWLQKWQTMGLPFLFYNLNCSDPPIRLKRQKTGFHLQFATVSI